jgi:hypothetical protein
VIEFLTSEPWAAGRLAREPGWVLDSVVRADQSDVFAVWLNTVDDYDVRAAEARQEGRRQLGARRRADQAA